MFRELLDNYAAIIVPILGSLFMAACVWVGKRIERCRDPARYRFREPPGIIGGLIYTGLRPATTSPPIAATSTSWWSSGSMARSVRWMPTSG